jgi:hypothetical protein
MPSIKFITFLGTASLGNTDDETKTFKFSLLSYWYTRINDTLDYFWYVTVNNPLAIQDPYCYILMPSFKSANAVIFAINKWLTTNNQTLLTDLKSKTLRPDNSPFPISSTIATNINKVREQSGFYSDPPANTSTCIQNVKTYITGLSTIIIGGFGAPSISVQGEIIANIKDYISKAPNDPFVKKILQYFGQSLNADNSFYTSLIDAYINGGNDSLNAYCILNPDNSDCTTSCRKEFDNVSNQALYDGCALYCVNNPTNQSCRDACNSNRQNPQCLEIYGPIQTQPAPSVGCFKPNSHSQQCNTNNLTYFTFINDVSSNL